MGKCNTGQLSNSDCFRTSKNEVFHFHVQSSLTPFGLHPSLDLYSSWTQLLTFVESTDLTITLVLLVWSDSSRQIEGFCFARRTLKYGNQIKHKATLKLKRPKKQFLSIQQIIQNEHFLNCKLLL